MSGRSNNRLWIRIATAAVAALCVVAAVCPFSALALSPPVGTLLTNTVTADYVTANGYRYPRLSAAVTTEISGAPMLNLLASASPDPVPAGGTAHITVILENSGNLAAGSVTVTLPLPATLQFVAASSGGHLSGADVVWIIGSLAPGASINLTLDAVVDAALPNGNLIPLGINALSAEGVTVTTTVSLTVGSAPRLAISTSAAQNSVLPGGTIEYTLTYQNIGSSLASGVVLRNEIPVGTALVAGSAGSAAVGSDRTLSWDLGTLLMNDGGTVTFAVVVSPVASAGELIRNRSTIGSVETAQVLSNEVVVPVVALPSRTPGQIHFIDAGGNPVVQYQVGEPICVEVNDGDRNLDPGVVETVTAHIDHEHPLGDGTTRVDDTVTIILDETAAASGIFRGCAATNSGPPLSLDAILSLERDSSIRASYTDPADAVPTTTAAAFIDPYGVVFDSVTGLPVANAEVTLIDEATGLPALLPQPPLVPAVQANPVTTGADGLFQFRYVPAGGYHIQVRSLPGATNFTFPSRVTDGDLPAGHVVVVGSRGESFPLTSGMTPLNLDLPVDPPPGQLQVGKAANKESASIGDLVAYTVSIANYGTTPVRDLRIIDLLPHGLAYRPGSSRLAGIPVADPRSDGKRTLVWPLALLNPGTEIVLSYTVIIGPDSQRGDGKNIVHVEGVSVGTAVTSNTAAKAIKIDEGIFTRNGIVLGKVYIDRDHDLRQQESGEEEGVGGVVLFLEDGTRLITDSDGKFSLAGVRSGTHLLRLDERSLPAGLRPHNGEDRFTPGGATRLIDLTVGGLFQADFPLQRTVPEVPIADATPLPRPAEEESIPVPTTSPSELEKRILAMTPELDFLNLADGTIVATRNIKFLVKGSADGDLSVTINGDAIPSEHIGKHMTTRRVALYEYVNVPLRIGEKNLLRAEVRDPFGNLREVKSVTVIAAGVASGIKLSTSASEVPADGTSTVMLRAQIHDQQGTVVPYPERVTVDTSLGEVVADDLDGTAPGIQVPCRNGVAEIAVKAPFTTGTAKLTVSYGEVEAQTEVFFAPHLRNLMVVGLGEATLGYRHRTRGGADYDNNLGLWGRGAFFVKGEIGAGTLLTAAYDSDKDKPQDYFHGGNANPEAEDRYPLYGDESKFGHEAMSRDKLYARIDKGHSSLLFGDYETNLGETRLSAYSRTLTGLKGEVVLDRAKLSAFASETDQSQVIEALPGRGVAGYYFLKQSPVDGSERVMLETRDRLQGDRVLQRQPLSRWSDYTIDYDLKSLLFKMPVPSHDANLNPIFIIVVYEIRGVTNYAVFGGRGTVKPLPWLEVGATAVTAEQATTDYRLLGGDVTLTLPARTTITAEVAQSASSFDLGGLPTAKSGSGWGIEVKSTPCTNFSLMGYLRSIGNYFDNSSATDVMRGTRKFGLEGSYGDKGQTRWTGKFQDEHDVLNATRHQRGALGAERNIGRTRLSAEVVRETSSDRYIAPATGGSRAPFAIDEETAREMTAAKVGLESPLTTDLSLVLSHLQDLQFNRHNLSQAGLNYQLSAKQRLYLREEYARFAERSESRTVIGGESHLGENTLAFDEYRIASGSDGGRTEQSIGLRHKYLLGDKLSGNLSLEKLMTLSGQSRNTEPESFAASTGIEYLPSAVFKLTSRLEYRRESSANAQDSWLGEFGGACRLARDYTLLVSERYFFNDFDHQGTRVTTRTAAGLAYRPVYGNRFNALGKVEFKHEQNSIQPETTLSNAYIGTLEGVYQATRRLQLTGKYAGKKAIENALDSYTDLVAGRILYDLTLRFDVGVEGRVLTNHTTGSRLLGGTVEVGYRVVDQLWLAVGYAFDRFDADLAGDNAMGEGPFLRIRLKIDEESLMALPRGKLPFRDGKGGE